MAMTSIATNTINLLHKLIGFKTVSSDSNKEMIAFICDYLSSFGVEAVISSNKNANKANLYATIGPQQAGGLMLAGHSDVVPVEGQNWATDPFVAKLHDGRVYGRGACDMKGFIAASLALVPILTKRDLGIPVHLAFTYDEEIGCFGAQELTATLSTSPYRPLYCIVGEPTGMRIVNGHKGKLSIDCTVTGAECHSAYNDRGVNAVEIAAEVITYFRSLQSRIKRDGRSDSRFDPPYTTIHTGVIRGGVARNIVPGDCQFEVEIRNLPGDDPMNLMNEVKKLSAENLFPEMHQIFSGSTVNFDLQSEIPALSPDDTHDFLHHVSPSSASNQHNVVSFATEAGLYQRSGIQAIVCGPGHIIQAHKPNEYVELTQLDLCNKFLMNIIDEIETWPQPI
jgi:acetylornithine deacetylase